MCVCVGGGGGRESEKHCMLVRVVLNIVCILSVSSLCAKSLRRCLMPVSIFQRNELF